MNRDAQSMTEHPGQVAAAKPCEGSLFERSVAGHIGWIHSMACRQLADASLADDATQAVFLALWRKRGRLKKPIGGLLVRATRYACNDIQKSERRRKIRERKVAAMRQEEMQGFASAAAEEAKIEQLLAMDAALQRLSTGDRDVLVARFFQNQTARQVAEQFNISEAAAGKRITRAVTKLRGIMDQKNIAMDSTALAALLSSGAATAPNGLLEKVLQGVCGKAPVSLTAAHAAHSITFHTAHIPAIAGAAAVTVAVGVATIVPMALKVRQISVQPTPTQATTGVLTCVAYDMLVQKDFAWAVKTGGKLLSGKPGGVQAYDISANVIRALARAQSGGQRVVLGPRLHWLSTPSPFLQWRVDPPGFMDFHHLFGNGGRPLSFLLGRSIYSTSFAYQHSVILNVQHPFTDNKTAASQIFAQTSFVWHDRAYPGSMRVQLKTGRWAGISYVYRQISIHRGHIPYAYQGTLNIRPSRAVVLLRRAIPFHGSQWYSAVIFDVERYPYRLLSSIRNFSSLNRYIRSGPAGLERTAAVAVAWNHYALAHPIKPQPRDRKWSASLPSGATFTLEAISSGKWPLCHWSADGFPEPGNSYFLQPGRIAALFEIHMPAERDQSMLGKIVGAWKGSFWGRASATNDSCSIGVDSGRWKILGTAVSVYPPYNGSAFSYMGYSLELYNVFSAPHDPARKILGSITLILRVPRSAPGLADRAIAVGGVDAHGNLVAPFPCGMGAGLGGAQTSRASSIGEYEAENIFSPTDVNRFVWITRPRHWVTFHGFAMQPTVLPTAVFALTQHQHPGHATGKANNVNGRRRAPDRNQSTPVGLMALLRHQERRGDQASIENLFYAPTAVERNAVKVAAKHLVAREGYGLWSAARARFGIAQMRSAGLGDVLDSLPSTLNYPTHWRIQGAYATPITPLPTGVSWPAKGQPLHKLIRRNDLWYFNFTLTKPQIAKVQTMLRDMNNHPPPKAKPYAIVIQQLQAGKIKDAYALRDQLETELKRYPTPSKFAQFLAGLKKSVKPVK